MINRRVAVILCLLTPLAACVTGSNSSTPTPFQAKFVPLDAIMPFPNDLYFNGSKTGTLNIPTSANTSVQAQESEASLLELNHLDGFGTQSDINIYFNAPVDATTLASNVLVFKVSSSATTKAVNPVAPAGTGTISPALKEGVDYSIALSAGTDTGGEIVTIKPLKPLAPSSVDPSTGTPVPSTYLVVVTNGVKDTNGDAVGPSSDYASILAADLPVLAGQKMGTTGNTQLDQVALFTLPQLIDAAAAKVDPTSIAVTFSFSTAYLNLTLGEISAMATATAQPAGVGIIDTGKTVCQVLVASKQLPSLAACAGVLGSTGTEVYAGTVALPYYLTVPKTGSTAALTDSWHNAKGGDTAISTDPTSILAVPTVQQNVIPILVATPIPGGPCGAVPVSGWPTVIFQHGITRNREDMLAMASGFGGSCFAVVAIDLPLHGVTSTSDPFYEKGFERTFDMGMTGAAGATGSTSSPIDTSGAWFINLTSTITSRDNLREGAADLLNLAITLPTLSAVTPSPLTVNTFDGSRLFFVGHSLGGIVGTTFLGADALGTQIPGTTHAAPLVVAATLANPGGHIAELLRNSPEFEPIIDAQLQANGIVKGTQFYYDFYSEAQAVAEDGDPANYAAAAALAHPIHMLEVIGNGTTTYPPDQVVPNSATELLASVMGLPKITTTTVTPTGAHGLVQFIFGDHGSILSPAAPTGASAGVQANYAAVTTEMQTEMVVFAAGNLSPALPGNGETILIKNSAVIKQ